MTDNERTRRGFLAAAAGLTTAFAGCNAPTTEQQGGTGGDTGGRQAQQVNGTSAGAGESVYSEVYESTVDSVVLVRTYGSRGRNGQGSGFVYDNGFVVTNQHVVEGADRVQVRFRDGTWSTATVRGTDFYSDLAAVEVDDQPDSAPSLPLVDGEVQVGQEVVAIGNPFGLSGSVSAGIVSGVDRAIPASTDPDDPNFSIPDAIQTDAAVNPGNSGGPLMTLDGRVAGVINSGGGDNIAFAISAALMRRVIPALIQDGEYAHSYMGVQLTTVTPPVARANDLPETTGVYIDAVLDGGPSDGVLQGSTGQETVRGVQTPVGGDVVLSMDGRPIPTRANLSTFLALETAPGDTIAVTLIRDGRQQTLDLTLGRRPEPNA